MIARNFRRFPEALALQLPLPLGKALQWALPRPTTRLLRQIRAARARLVAAQPRVQWPEPRKVPAWWRAAQAAKRAFAAGVRTACMAIFS